MQYEEGGYMNMKTIGYVVLAVGVIAALVSVLADAIGIGSDDGFGSQQLTLLIVGLIVAGVGGYLSFRPASS